MKITKRSLQSRIAHINALLGRPMEQFTSKVGEPTMFSVGHLNLDCSAYGYALEEQTSVHGGVSLLVSGQTARQMDDFLQGIMRGIGLQKVFVTQQVIRAELVRVGLGAEDAPLYHEA